MRETKSTSDRVVDAEKTHKKTSGFWGGTWQEKQPTVPWLSSRDFGGMKCFFFRGILGDHFVNHRLEWQKEHFGQKTWTPDIVQVRNKRGEDPGFFH